MPTTAERLTVIRAAIDELRAAAQHDNDSARATTADWLDQLFDDVGSREELRAACGDARGIFSGGMGSFQDVGTETMDQAVEQLREALRPSWC